MGTHLPSRKITVKSRPTSPKPIRGAAPRRGELVPAVAPLVECLRHSGLPRGAFAPGTEDAAEHALTAAVGAERRIADLNRRISDLERVAITDELTGLLNRRGFEAELAQALALARRYNEPGVLVYVDLDGFKLVNDTYGHGAGDEVLRRVARLLSGAVRATDFVGRLGGDEFAVLLVRTSWNGALIRLRAIRRLLDPAVIDLDGRTIAVRASLGVEVYGGEDEGVQLMGRADRAMYAAKRDRTAGGTVI